ncbi:DNA polymerase II, partial [bacterium]|nr:DNA polymerase II [bacterium]
RDILNVEGLIELTVRRSMLTGLQLDRAWGSVAAFDFLYVSALHKRKIVAPTNGVDRPKSKSAPGGLVMPPKTGLYRNILVFDFKSLYPSIIRTFNIDPLSRIMAESAPENDCITAPNEACFHRKEGILPEILDTFFTRRDQAKRENNALESYVYKIIMNSFYGVLGTRSCRFSTGYLAGAITEFGHYILKWVRNQFIELGLEVIYGDTDSLFVNCHISTEDSYSALLARGEELCIWVNTKLDMHLKRLYHVDSRLELEFEKVYTRFLLPSARGQHDQGRAKAYAGLRDSKLEIVGMEAVRRDWTNLAQTLQRELLMLLFTDAEPRQIEQCVYGWIDTLKKGEIDGDLVYHKNLRKPVSSYTAMTPPHVKAAMLLPRPSGVIHYVMTINGPQPLGHVNAALDYTHYIKKQIEPIARSIAQIRSFDIDAAITGEQSLFG